LRHENKFHVSGECVSVCMCSAGATYFYTTLA